MRGHWNPQRFYCAHCPVCPTQNGFTDHASTRTHLANDHGIERAKIEQGVDYYDGVHASRVYARRKEEADVEANRAARVLLQSNYTVEDFLTDAGDQPWPALLEYEDE